MATPKPASSSFAWYSWMSTASRSCGDGIGGAPGLDGLGDLDDVAGHARGGGVDHPAIELGRAAPLARRLFERLENPPGARHLLRRGREHLVGERDLRGVDGPLTLAAQRRRA